MFHVTFPGGLLSYRSSDQFQLVDNIARDLEKKLSHVERRLYDFNYVEWPLLRIHRALSPRGTNLSV